jgi:hypothetical protein
MKVAPSFDELLRIEMVCDDVATEKSAAEDTFTIISMSPTAPPARVTVYELAAVADTSI